jgi:hypothetical protein
VTTLEDVRPGDLMFGPIGGFVPGVLPVGVAQILLATRKDRLTWRLWWELRHVAVVVQESMHLPPGTVRHRETGTYYPPDEWGRTPWREAPHGGFDSYPTGVITAPRVVEAMPDGARERDLGDRDWAAGHVFVRPMLDNSQGVEIATAARNYIGTPYGFLTYGALGANFLIPDGSTGKRLESAIARRITDRKEMICSQLADQALADAGVHVFRDGRLPQDVVPSELFLRLLDRPGTRYVVPGMDDWASAGDFYHKGWRS